MRQSIALILSLALLCVLSVPVMAGQESQPTATTEVAETTAAPTEPEPTATQAPTEPETLPPTEPVSQPTEEPFDPNRVLSIDVKHRYSGMDRPFEDGYQPGISNGDVYLVLPLLANQPLKDDQIRVALNLGSGESPFVIANYQKDFHLDSFTPEGEKEAQELFLVNFAVELRWDRMNGVYPVEFRVSGQSLTGETVEQTYTLFVTITDGRSTEPTIPEPEQPTADPVVYLSKVSAAPKASILAGEEFTVNMTVQNSLDDKPVEDLLMRVRIENSQLELKESSSVFELPDLKAGGNTEVTLHFQSEESIPAGKYSISVEFTYGSGESLHLSASDSFDVAILQDVNMELTKPQLPAQVTVGDTVPLSLQVLNMGREQVYNVRCTVEGTGLNPNSTGFIGTMAPGSSATTQISLYISALNLESGSRNTEAYGETTATVKMIFEDATGKTYEQTEQIQTNVQRPPLVPEDSVSDEEIDQAKAFSVWWILIAVLGGGCLAAGGVLFWKQYKKKMDL